MHAATVDLKVDSADTIVIARAAGEPIIAQARREAAFDACLEIDESGRKARHQLAALGRGKFLNVLDANMRPYHDAGKAPKPA